MTGASLVRGFARTRLLPVRRVTALLGPAWIVMLADVDAPSVLTAAQGGSRYGYALLLPLFILVPVLYLVQELTARLGAVSRLGHAALVRRHYGAGWAALSVASMAGVNLVAYLAEFAGIVLGASLVGIPAPMAVAGALLLHTLMVLTGSYRSFERAALLLSGALVAFVAVAITSDPHPGAVWAGLTSPQPFGAPGYGALVVATIGAVVMPWMLYFQQAATVDKRLEVADLPAARRETLLGAVASELLMAAVVIAAATAMHLPAVGSSGAGSVLPAGFARMAHGPVTLLLATGLVGASLLAAVVISLASAWGWAELLDRPRSLDLSPRRAPLFYAVYLLEVLPAAALVLVARDLVALVIGAMVWNVVLLAVPLGFLVRMAADRSILGPRANGPVRTALSAAVAAGLVALGCAAALGMLG